MVTAAARRRRLIHVPLAVVLVVLAAAAVTELGAFATLRWLERPGRERADPRLARAIYRDQPWARALWRETHAVMGLARYAPYVVWTHAPFNGETIVVDAEGRRRTTRARCEPGARTVYMFGGSTLWGFGVPDNATIPSYLAEAFARDGEPACIVNFGELAWVSTQEVVRLVLALKQAAPPHDVVFYDGCNDVLTADKYGAADAHTNFAEIRDWMETRSRQRAGSFAFLTHSNTATLLARLGLRPTIEPPPADRAALAASLVGNYLRNVEVVAALGRRYGFRPTFFWQPVILLGDKVLTEEERRYVATGMWRQEPLAALYAAAAARVRGAPSPPVYYLGDVFAGVRDELYLDLCHLGPEGNRRIAARMREVLRRAPPA